jgi:hypothetical protein
MAVTERRDRHSTQPTHAHRSGRTRDPSAPHRFGAVRAERVVGARVLLLLVGFARAAVAQEPEGVQAAVNRIRDRYAAIQQALSRYDSTVAPWESPGGSGTVTAYREAGALRKLAVRFDGDGASWRAEYFFWDDSLVFGYRRWERFPEGGDSRVSEDRWYVSDGRVLRWARVEEDGGRRTVPATDAAFASSAEAFLGGAGCWRRFAEGRERRTPFEGC